MGDLSDMADINRWLRCTAGKKRLDEIRASMVGKTVSNVEFSNDVSAVLVTITFATGESVECFIPELMLDALKETFRPKSKRNTGVITLNVGRNQRKGAMMSEKRMSPDEVAEIRHRVQVAFGELRKVGFITKTNLSCCMSCAVAELGEIAEKRRRNRAAYWHRQDEEHFKKRGLLDVRYCYLPPRNIKREETSALETQIGEQVADALRKAGLAVEWNGNPATTIQVTGITSNGKEVANGTTTTV